MLLSQHKDQGGKIFLGGKLSEPQSPLTPCACFISHSLPTTLSPINTMSINVVQCTFCMTCALAFTRSPPPNRKMSATTFTILIGENAKPRRILNLEFATLKGLHQHEDWFYFLYMCSEFKIIHRGSGKCRSTGCWDVAPLLL